MGSSGGDSVLAELPVACALGSGDGAERLRRWHALAGKSPPRARRSGNRVEVRWQLDAHDAAELAALVDAERACCSFLSWAVSREGTRSVLTVTADPTKPDDVAAIAALFGAT
jgi:hypothetical protein